MKPKTLFANSGYDLHSEVNDALWLVSRILNCSPFADEVVSLTVPQIDFIIGKYALSNPEVGKDIRPDLFTEQTDKTKQEVAWASTLPKDALIKRLGLDNPEIRKRLGGK